MADGRPKPISLATGHRSKAEKEFRAKAEKELMTGNVLQPSTEVKNSPIALKEFNRIKKLLQAIEKDDDLCGDTINIFCILVSECSELEKMKRELSEDLETLSNEYKSSKIDTMGYMAQKNTILANILAFDKKIMDKRKMRNDIAKENIMTIQSALRSIPKKAPPESEDLLLKALRGEDI